MEISFLKKFFLTLNSVYPLLLQYGRRSLGEQDCSIYCPGYVDAIPHHFNAIQTSSCIRPALPVFLLRSPVPHPQTPALDLFHYAKDRPQRLFLSK